MGARSLRTVRLSGDNAAWLLLGLIEASVVVLLAISLIRGEFLPQRRKLILLTGLPVSVLAYGVMIVANAMIGNNPTVIELFTYWVSPQSSCSSCGRCPPIGR